MKTKVLVITTMIFSVLLLKAQEGKTYLPVFGENSTRYYVGWHAIDIGQVFSYLEYLKNPNNENQYIPSGWTAPPMYNVIEVSKDNSKIWGKDMYNDITYNEDLLMDLNLDIGDVFIGTEGYEHIVSKVYEKGGRKHIEFEGLFSVNMGIKEVIVEEMPLIFIEGVGPNITMTGDVFDSAFGVVWLLSQYKDGELSYGVPEWYPYWEHIEEGSSHQSFKISDIQIIPNPGDETVKLILSDQLQENNSKLNVRDATGKTIDILEITSNPYTFNTHRYAPGIYFLEVISDRYKLGGKFIKKQTP